MTRIVKIIIIFSTVTLIDLTYSCCGRTFKLMWTDIYLKNLDNSGQNSIETSSRYINKKAYGIRVEFQDEQIANNFASGIISSSWATSCYDDYIYTDTIEYIKILTNADFDENHFREADL